MVFLYHVGQYFGAAKQWQIVSVEQTAPKSIHSHTVDKKCDKHIKCSTK